MKKNTLNRFLYGRVLNITCCVLALCSIALVSCKARKPLVVNRVVDIPKPVNTKTSKIAAIKAAQLYFNTFSGKARTKLDIGGNSNDVTLNIRINRDKKIWVSVTAIAGIEVARALITPDSVLIMNKLQSVYIKQPFSYINQFAGNQVNYKTVESLLAGNVIPELLTEDGDMRSDSAKTIIAGNLQGLMYRLLVGADMRATQTNLNDQAAGQSLQVTNSAFSQFANRVVPAQIDITSVVKGKKIQVNLHYVKVEFDQPLEYPFSIPARYSPAN